MAKIQMDRIGEVKSQSGQLYDVYWNSVTNQIFVGCDPAGWAFSWDQAMRNAEFYATTGRQMKN
jgi:hypothetical protein